MAFCQGFCNWVFQPPFQLRGVGIYSHGCKQGLFSSHDGRVGLTLGLRYGRGDHAAGTNDLAGKSR